MRVLPVITRELRAQARQPFTYWLRAMGVVALLGFGLLFVSERLFEPELGGALFGRMHLVGYVAIWLLVPLGAADCISRERREGTLGLLFLTPLRPVHIVVSKVLVHGLRAGTLLLAIIPVLTIPFLLGGVTWQQAAVAVAVDFSAVCWCLGAALVASSLARSGTRAMALAMVLAVVAWILSTYLVGALIGMNSQTTWLGGYSQAGYDFLVGFAVAGMNSDRWDRILTVFKPGQVHYAVSVATMIAGSALVLAVLVAANRIRRAWREEPPSVRVQQMQHLFCEPVLGARLLHRWMQRKLDRNPIGWLEQRRWSGRMVTWAWFTIIITVYSAVLTDRNFFRGGGELQQLMAWLLAISMAVSAAGSFRRERESGVLELLLVSPLTTRQIISGRLRGLWGQFLPAVMALLGIWGYFIHIFRHDSYSFRWSPGNEWMQILFFAVSFLVMPVVGLYFSVRCRHFISALLLTLIFVFGLPLLLSFALDMFPAKMASGNPRLWAGLVVGGTLLVQLLVATYLLLRLHHQLEHRSFPLEQPAV